MIRVVDEEAEGGDGGRVAGVGEEPPERVRQSVEPAGGSGSEP
jgi:hypothetical protein